MRVRTVLWTLSGAVCCYVIAACAGDAERSAGDTGTRRDSGAAQDTLTVGVDSAIAAVDALGDALGVDLGVPDAEAGPTPGDTVSIAPCSIRSPAPGGAYDYLFAEQTYPGRTANDLARGTVILCYATTPLGQAPGYACQAGKPSVRDGAVASYCGTSASPSTNATEVRFVMPPP